MPGQTRLFGVAHCASCGAEVEQPERAGRTREFCSHACRQRAYRTRDEIRSAAKVHSDPAVTASPDPAPRARSLTEVAAGIPTPVDPMHGPCRAYVDVRDDLRYGVHFATDAGRGRQLVAEPTFRGPRDAMALASLLNSRLASATAGAPPSLGGRRLPEPAA